jgi:hypothetical protein
MQEGQQKKWEGFAWGYHGTTGRTLAGVGYEEEIAHAKDAKDAKDAKGGEWGPPSLLTRFAEELWRV